MNWTDAEQFPPLSQDAASPDFVPLDAVDVMFSFLCSNWRREQGTDHIPNEQYLALFVRAVRLVEILKEIDHDQRTSSTEVHYAASVN